MFTISNKIRVMIPIYKNVNNQDTGKAFTVYCIEVVHNGKRQVVEKRYSEFNELYRKLQKIMYVKAPFPPKRVLNKDSKLLETRRVMLECYLQTVLYEAQDDIPQRLLEFLDLPNFYDDMSSDDGQLEDSDGEEHIQSSAPRAQQNMVCFKKGIYLYQTSKEHTEDRILPSIIVKGCLDAIYNG